MLSIPRPSLFARRALSVAAVLGASVLGMSAQTATEPATVATTTAQVPAQRTTLDLSLPAALASREEGFSSSSVSSADDQIALNIPHLDFVNAMQYGGGRRRYGRPRYRGGNTNPDGSNKYSFFFGGGFTKPVGNTYKYNNPSYSFQGGAGRNFNKTFGLNFQFDWDNFGLTGRNIATQRFLYNQIGAAIGLPTGFFNDIDGHAHVWSFSLNPMVNLYSGEGLGAYVVGGVGFYHKVTNFTLPQLAYQQDQYTGQLYAGYVQQSFDQYSSNAPGYNGGFGLTYKFSKFSNERLYGEVRYVFVNNPQRQGLTLNNFTNNAILLGNNDYPANSNRTTYIPVKFGIRF